MLWLLKNSRHETNFGENKPFNIIGLQSTMKPQYKRILKAATLENTIKNISVVVNERNPKAKISYDALPERISKIIKRFVKELKTNKTTNGELLKKSKHFFLPLILSLIYVRKFLYNFNSF